MFDTGLSLADRAIFERDLCLDHQAFIRIVNMSLEHDDLHDISDRLMDGQVTYDANAEITTRSLTMVLMDPNASLGFDTGNPTGGILFADRMVQVHYEVFSRGLWRWVSVPIFTGPVSKMTRNGSTISVEAQGKETLAREGAASASYLSKSAAIGARIFSRRSMAWM